MSKNPLGECQLCHGNLATFGDEVRCGECGAPVPGHDGSREVDQVVLPEVKYRGGKCYVTPAGEEKSIPVVAEKPKAKPKRPRVIAGSD